MIYVLSVAFVSHMKLEEAAHLFPGKISFSYNNELGSETHKSCLRFTYYPQACPFGSFKSQPDLDPLHSVPEELPSLSPDLTASPLRLETMAEEGLLPSQITVKRVKQVTFSSPLEKKMDTSPTSVLCDTPQKASQTSARVLRKPGKPRKATKLTISVCGVFTELKMARITPIYSPLRCPESPQIG